MVQINKKFKTTLLQINTLEDLSDILDTRMQNKLESIKNSVKKINQEYVDSSSIHSKMFQKGVQKLIKRVQTKITKEEEAPEGGDDGGAAPMELSEEDLKQQQQEANAGLQAAFELQTQEYDRQIAQLQKTNADLQGQLTQQQQEANAGLQAALAQQQQAHQQQQQEANADFQAQLQQQAQQANADFQAQLQQQLQQANNAFQAQLQQANAAFQAQLQQQQQANAALQTANTQLNQTIRDQAEIERRLRGDLREKRGRLRG